MSLSSFAAHGKADGPSSDREAQLFSRVSICSSKDDSRPPQPNSIEDLTRDDGSVYHVAGNRWTQASEQDFAKWVKTNVDAHFMETYNLSTDCAKASAVVRAVYARIAHLPALFTNRHERVGHFSREWSSLPTVVDWSGDNWKSALQTDQRFRAYLDGVMHMISTSTIIYNTYPLQLNDPQNPNQLSQFIHEGEPLVDKTHVRFISAITPNTFLPVQELASDLPVEVRELNAGPFSLFDYPLELGRGLVSWRWPVECRGEWNLTPAPLMPGFSMQQYELPTEPSLAAARSKVADLEKDMSLQQDGLTKLGFSHGSQHVHQSTPLVNSTRSKTQREASEQNRELHRAVPLTAQEKFDADTFKAKIEEDKKQLELTKRTVGLYLKNPALKYVGTFAAYVHSLAGQRAPNLADIKSNIDVLESKIKDRVTIVNGALDKLKSDPHTFDDPSASVYDDYSTPERDKQAFLLWRNLSSTMKAFDTQQLSLSDKMKKEMSSRTIDLTQGQTINLEVFMESFPAGKVSNNPADSFMKRWGLDNTLK